MTLKEFLKSDVAKLFSKNTRLYVEQHEGCYYHLNKLNYMFNLGNALTSFNEQFLNQEISLITCEEYDALTLHFKDND